MKGHAINALGARRAAHGAVVHRAAACRTDDGRLSEQITELWSLLSASLLIRKEPLPRQAIAAEEKFFQRHERSGT